MNKFFIFLSLFLVFLCISIIFLTVFNIQLLENLYWMSYLNILIYPILFITIFLASKKDLKYKQHPRLLTIFGFIGLITVFLFIILQK